MEARLIHNLKVAGSNPEGGDIFSERYLARKGVEKRERERELGGIVKETWDWRELEKSSFFLSRNFEFTA